MLSPGTAPAKQLQLPFARRGEASVGTRGEDAPVESSGLMEQVVERSNLFAALSRVKRNGGSPGIDGMSVKALPEYLKRRWPEIRESLLSGTYEPQPVRRAEILNPGGGVRKLVIPTVPDRFIQQALDRTFWERSYGFRPGRSVQQAVAQAQRYLGMGCSRVVDLDVDRQVL